MMQVKIQQKQMLGVTLLELMVALAISSFLMLGIFQIYFSARATDSMGGALSRMQETGRVALDLMAKDIRLAGYQGCLDPKQFGSLAIGEGAFNLPTIDLGQTGIRGFTVGTGWANGTEFVGTEITGGLASDRSALSGTSVIAIQRGASASAKVISTSETTITLEANLLNLAQNDMFVVASCSAAHLTRALNVTDGDGDEKVIELFDKLDVQYASAQSPGYVMRFLSTAYFVADTGRVNSAGNAVYALYRQWDNSTNAASDLVIEELVEGVENLQVLYGQRIGTNNIRYVPAGTSGLNMANVVSVKIGILVASTQNVQQENDNLSYLLPGITVEPGVNTGVNHLSDRRIRRTFVTTINIRNRQT